MHVAGTVAPSPASLPSPAIARRLAELCGEERDLVVDFLRHLAEFDSREAWAGAGYGSLWAYCTEALHLREGAAWRRIGAMNLLRRFPALEGALRSGKLCLTTVNQLGPVLTEENLEEMVGRAAFLSKADTARLVVSIRPKVAPKDGIRRVAAAVVAPAAEAEAAQVASAAAVPASDPLLSLALSGPVETGCAPGPSASRAELRPVAAETYSLRVTLDADAKAERDELVALLSNKHGGNLAEVLREAVRCGIAKHGKRKGAVEPERKRAAAPGAGLGSADPRFIPMEVKRAVWERDGGRCAWVSPDGKRCGSRHKLEFGHIRPVALGGKATLANIRLECRPHNQFEAVRVFGREHMAPFSRRGTSSRGSHGP